MEFLPIRLTIAAAFAGSARQRRTTRHRLGDAPRYGARLSRQASLQHPQAGGFMKTAGRLLSVALSISLAASLSVAEPRQVVQGTQINLKLLTDISSKTSRDGDPFMAVTTEQVMLGDQILLPAGTRIRGIVSSISPAKHLHRGEAGGRGSVNQQPIDSGADGILELPSVTGDGLAAVMWTNRGNAQEARHQRRHRGRKWAGGAAISETGESHAMEIWNRLAGSAITLRSAGAKTWEGPQHGIRFVWTTPTLIKGPIFRPVKPD